MKKILSMMLVALTMVSIFVMPANAAGEINGKPWEDSQSYVTMDQKWPEFPFHTLTGYFDYLKWRPVIDITVAEDGSGSIQVDLYFNKKDMESGLIGKNGYPEGSIVTDWAGIDWQTRNALPVMYKRIQTPRVTFKDFTELNAYLVKVAHWNDDCYTIKAYNEYVDGYKYIGIHENPYKLMTNIDFPKNQYADYEYAYKPIYVIRTSAFNNSKKNQPGIAYFGNGGEAFRRANSTLFQAFFFTPDGCSVSGCDFMVPYKKTDATLNKEWRNIMVDSTTVKDGKIEGTCESRTVSAWNRAYLQNYDQVFGLDIHNTVTLDNGIVLNCSNPEKTLTIAGAVRIASMTHSLYKKDNEKFTVQPGEYWYMPYVRYAVKEGIIPNAWTVTNNPNKTAARLELLRMLYKAIPQTEWKVKSQYTMPYDTKGLYDADKAVIQVMGNADIFSGTETSYSMEAEQYPDFTVDTSKYGMTKNSEIYVGIYNRNYGFRSTELNANPWKPVTVQDAAIWTSRMMADYIY